MHSSLFSMLLVAGIVHGAPAASTASARPSYKPDDPPLQLDPRINPEKITQSDIPPGPQVHLLPLPPDHRISEQSHRVPVDATHWKLAQQGLRRGIDALLARRDAQGVWMAEVRIAPTSSPAQASEVALAATALGLKILAQAGPGYLQEPGDTDALTFLLANQSKDGSFGSSALGSYVTAAVVSALSAIDRSGFSDEIESGTHWLEDNQWDEGEGLSQRQDWYGGSGYGNRGRPDLSNTQAMLDALYDAGYSPDEPAIRRALDFVSRTQNHRLTNLSPWAGDDGGFVYTAANGGESMSSQFMGEGRYGELLPPGTARSLRSYGSMSYAGFKSMLYAGMGSEDSRVRAVLDWVRHHWTFEENPGVGQQGLYYYYHTLARALRIAQFDAIEDIDGRRHNWREELIDALSARQHKDGSWVNPTDRWLEGHPTMATIYALLALEEILKPAPVNGDGPPAAGDASTP